MNIFLKLLKYYFGTIFLGTALIISVYLLPMEPIRDNVVKSIHLLLEEGDYPTYDGIYGYTTLENYTDALMLNIAAYDGDESVLERAMMNYRINYEGELPTSSLDKMVNNVGNGKKVEYSRYWHGYLITLKPLLMLFSYQEIRVINSFVIFLLLVMTVLLMYKRCGFEYVFAFSIAVLILNPTIISLSLEYSDIFYITVLSIIFLLYKKEWLDILPERYYILFLLIGMVTSYYDLLTYPIVSLGMPLIVFVLIHCEDYMKQMKKIVSLSAIWSFGYVGMWAAKWIISTTVTGSDVISNAMNRIMMRAGNTNSEENLITIKDVLLVNFRMLFNKPIIVLIIITGIVIVFIISSKYQQLCIDKNRIIPLWFISTYPFIWYFATKNHSYIHPRITYRGMSIFVFGLLCIIISLSIRKNQNRI